MIYDRIMYTHEKDYILQRRHIMGKRFRKKRKKAESFALSKSPSSLELCYFASGPLVALGFLLGGPPLALVAFLTDGCFCLLLYLYKHISSHRH